MFDITKRQAKLIKAMSSQRDYKPAKYYAEYLKVSERTVFNDLAKLEEIFKVFNLSIDRKPNQGIKVHGEIRSSEDFIREIVSKLKEEKAYSPLDRQILIAKKLLIENETVTYQSLSMDLFISTTSIIKDVDRIRSFMGDEVELVSDVKGTRVYGSEIGIQKTLKRFAYYLIEKGMHHSSLTSYARVLEPLFEKRVIDTVYQAVQDLLAILDMNVSEQYLKSLFISLLILTERSYNGQHLDDLPEIQIEGTEYLTNYPLAVQICHCITSKLGFVFTDLEHRYISNQLFAHRIEVKINNRYVEALFSNDIRRLIGDVSAAADIDLTDDEKLYDSLIYHVLPMIYRLKSDIDVYNPLLNEIKNNYGVLFRIIWYVIEQFEEKYGIKLTDDDVAFITIHFQVAIERKEKMAKILIVCQTGLVTSDLIINRIKNLLPANIQFKLIAKPNLQEECLMDVDFIISSVQLDDVAKPIVYVSPLVGDEDLLKIYSSYLKHSAAAKRKEQGGLEPDLFAQYVSGRYFFLNEEAATKEECLDKMIGRFEADGIVKEQFRPSVYERERLGNTLIQGWVAVPHAMTSMANQTKIAIMTTKRPIKWNGDSSASLIILLAVAEEDMVNVRKLLGHIYKLIFTPDSHEIMHVIKSISRPEELISLLHGNHAIPQP